MKKKKLCLADPRRCPSIQGAAADGAGRDAGVHAL